MHYLKTFKGTGLKGMLIAPSRLIAVRFKEILDDIGQVNSEVVISSTDDREDYEDIESENKIQKFLKNVKTRYGLEFNNRIIKEFKSVGDPEILIVVSKLLTGFDAPRNAVVYICKGLKEHTLLQAIARANRLFEEKGKVKEYGNIARP
ncbi:putative type I restriction enzyme restriction subunit-like protein [Rickettsia endosymbiont of Ixodes pacificus]|uniref:type I restriction enzyme subunit R domain-containing protein n=1 Tax=Rickettsia endosymbiont of Ixodes pacificus TaxID=1133329 RepID=UPI00061E6CBA|nr:type I restriction endonuclease subunit R [Rickettsia endosymbiont of Ixodes pacificus]KJW02815.1 putative type I restriction enzyme restriction subunit-like protein [Rickettsia endosymbiont of Ixodes pacificus]